MTRQLTLLPFKVIESKRKNSKVTSFSGLPLLSEVYQALGMKSAIKEHLSLKKRGWEESSVVENLIHLQAAGGEHMDDIDVLDKDDGLKDLIGYENLPSSATVRRFLNLFNEGMDVKRCMGEAYVPQESMGLKGLGFVNRHLANRIFKIKKPSCITLDIDATIVFSDKRTALPTYKGGTGYQPIIGTWAETGIIVADEFRDGNVPAAYDNLGFLKRCEAQFPGKTKFRIRSDGAAYTHDLMEYANKKGYEFAISADISQGLRRFINALPESQWKRLHRITDKGKEETKKEWVEISFSTAGLSQAKIKERVREYRYIVMRREKREPDMFDGKWEYDAIVTNMSWEAESLIHWHYERCGMIEHIIEAVKNDFGGGMLPCERFGANAAWWRISCLAYNLVQALKLIALPFQWTSYRMKRLRFKLFCVAGRVINHARQIYLQLARGHPILPIYNEARVKLSALAS